MRTAIGVLLAVVALAAQGPEGTATVRGRVVDAVTGKPIPRVAIHFSPQPRGSYAPGIDVQPPNRSAVADANGAFEVARLAAADYTVYANGAGGYLNIEYGASAPGRSGKHLVVGDRAELDITIKGWRPASITGRVVDERGRPVTGAQVRVFSKDPSAATGSGTTDDRGAYTVHALLPGDYAVGVSVSLSSRTISATAAKAPPSFTGSIFPYAIDRAKRTILLSQGAPFPPSTDDGRIQVYTTAFFGGGATETDAPRISLRSGETHTDVDITLPTVRGVRVSGIVSASETKGVIVTLTRRGVSQERSPMRIDATTAADGTFVFVAVPPGDYTLAARRRLPPLTEVTLSGGAPVIAWDDVLENDPEEAWAEMPMAIGDADVADLAVHLSAGTLVTGSLLYEGSAVRPRGRIAIVLAPADAPTSMNDRYPEIKPDGSFSLRLKPGRYRVLSRQYGDVASFRALIVNGIEIGDDPLIVGTEPLTDVRFAFALLDTAIRGSVSDRDGRPVPRGAVMIFPADRASWFRLDESHHARIVAFTNGTFAATGLPPGEYHVAALEDARAWLSIANIEAVIPRATRVTVRSGQPVTLNLTVEPRDR